MGAILRWQTMGGSGILVPPLGLIMGTTSIVPANWLAFTAPNGLFLKGTDSDATAGTTGSRSSLTTSTGSGGSHATGTSQPICDWGHWAASNDNSPSSDTGGVGSHSGHSITTNYRPGSNKLILIQAQEEAEFTTNMIGFSTADLSANHIAFTNFNNSNLLEGGTSIGTTALSKSTNTTGSKSDSHDHFVSSSSGSWVEDLSVRYTSTAGAGGNHNHSGGTPSISHSARTVLLRAWELFDVEKMDGIIGMYIGAGIPDGWQLVSECVGQYVKCSATGNGSQSGGANTVTFSGSTGNKSHSHSYSGSDTGLEEDARIHHSNSISHNHSYSATKAYEPERYNIKFVRYIG
jgi:hypothetical protein